MSKLDHIPIEYENQISQIIETSLIAMYGTKGYKSIIHTMIKECKKPEKEIIRDYELFADLTRKIFGKIGDTKILDLIKTEINKIHTT